MVAGDRKGIVCVWESVDSLELIVLNACNVDICLTGNRSSDIDLAALDVNAADTVLLVVFLAGLSASYHVVSPLGVLELAGEKTQSVIALNRVPGLAAVS